MKLVDMHKNVFVCLLGVHSIWDYLFSAYAKFSHKITFLTPDTHTSMSVSGGQRCYFSRKSCVCTKWIMPIEFLMFNKATFREERRLGTKMREVFLETENHLTNLFMT